MSHLSIKLDLIVNKENYILAQYFIDLKASFSRLKIISNIFDYRNDKIVKRPLFRIF
jgi:hypothetical protein